MVKAEPEKTAAKSLARKNQHHDGGGKWFNDAKGFGFNYPTRWPDLFARFWSINMAGLSR